MLFMIGIEEPKKKNEAYGILVPAFEKLGYGCITCADEEADILYQAKSIILDMSEEVIADGHDLKQLQEPYQDYSTHYPKFSRWIALEVPVESLKPKQKRINITLSEPLLARVDAYVAGHVEYKDRSDFLAKAADRQMRSW